MTLTEIYQPIRSELQATEALFTQELAGRDGLLGEMTRYIARMPGKRIRPALALFSAGLAGGLAPANVLWRVPVPFPSSPSHAVCLAAAVEMIHTATLLHDDVIDGASLRRGLSTLNAKWGDTLSVLSGDYLYSKAFCLLSELDHPGVLKLMSDTARTVCEGEVAQIQRQYDLNLSVMEYLKIIQAKTASLMGASVQAGALLGGASTPVADRLGEFGIHFGLAFQIVDDTQDLIGDEGTLGKSLGTDLALGHLTLPLIYLRDKGDGKARDRLAQWFDGNGSNSRLPSETQERLTALKTEALRYRVPSLCYRMARRYLTKSKEVLRPLPASIYKKSLLRLTEYLFR